MIHNGQLFNEEDLYQSVFEVLASDWRPLLKTELRYSYDDKTFHDLKEVGPIKHSILEANRNEYPSSARNLDKQLKEKGYKTTYSFSHKYHISQKMRSRIFADIARLDWFFQVYKHPALKPTERAKMAKIFEDASNVSYYYAQLIWANNPDAKFDYPKKLVPFLDWDRTLAFLYSVAFEFHPKDAHYFITEYNSHNNIQYKNQLVFQNWCKNKFGIDTGCLVLSPENMEKLRKILTKTDTPYAIQLLQKYFSILR